MPRGAKTGENRFKGAQEALTGYRLSRINEVVIPEVKALSAHTEINSINKYCRLCSDIYNRDLPINEKPISYRRLNQSDKYWGIIGPVYYKYFEKNHDLEDFKSRSSQALIKRELEEANEKLARYENENRVLKLTLSNESLNIDTTGSNNEQLNAEDIDNMGRIINLLIEKIQVVEISKEDGALRDLSDDFEDAEGMLPKHIVASYIRWLSRKSEVLEAFNE